MKKRILIGIGIFVVLIVVAAFLFLRNIDGLVKAAIEKYGSEAAGTPVRVQEVSIDLRAGRGSVHGLTVANPPGFSSRPAFRLGEITLELDVGSLASELPVVERIQIGEPAVRYELDAKGNTNVGRLKAGMENRAGHGGADGGTSGNANDNRPLRIQRLAIEGGKGTLDLSTVGGQVLEADLPRIVLTEIGGRQGITPAGLGRVVMAALIENLEKEAARRGVEGAIRSHLGETAERLEQKIDEKLAPGAADALRKALAK